LLRSTVATTGNTRALEHAAVCELALRATAALVVSQGSTAILADQDARWLAREALFLPMFGSRPPIRKSLAGLLTWPVPEAAVG